MLEFRFGSHLGFSTSEEEDDDDEDEDEACSEEEENEGKLIARALGFCSPFADLFLLALGFGGGDDEDVGGGVDEVASSDDEVTFLDFFVPLPMAKTCVSFDDLRILNKALWTKFHRRFRGRFHDARFC